MKTYNLNSIERIEIIGNRINIEYGDGIKFTIINNNQEIAFQKDLKNNNNAPEIDHCI